MCDQWGGMKAWRASEAVGSVVSDERGKLNIKSNKES